jgi:lipoprotein-releasing system permease protein
MGISLGVAFLIVSMAGFSGFTESLKSSIIDISGDVNVFKRGGRRISDSEAIEKQIRDVSPSVIQALGFVNLEVLVANKGQLNAVVLQGINWDRAQNLEELKRRTMRSLEDDSQAVGEPALLGKAVAQKLRLELGDSFKAILPKVTKASATRVAPRVQTFYVKSILDFGKYEFNERIVIAHQPIVQNLAEMGDQINGFRLRLKDSDRADREAERIQEALGWDYSVRDWSMSNRSLFKAIKYEKRVLFFVMLVMVIAAFFNVSTTLFLGVLKRYSQISVMRALGLKRRDVIVLFCLHGLALGFVGLSLGLVLGLFFCWTFENIQKIYPIMPEEVYGLSNFSTHLEWMDLFWVVVATLVICFLSTLAPAFRGAKLSPVEGLKYE